MRPVDRLIPARKAETVMVHGLASLGSGLAGLLLTERVERERIRTQDCIKGIVRKAAELNGYVTFP